MGVWAGAEFPTKMARLSSGKASRTARMTAAMRHRHHVGGLRPLVFDDNHAGIFLDFGSSLWAAPSPLSDWLFGRLVGPVRALEGEVLARSRYVDDVLAPRIEEGLRQILVLGAGFDTTALRFAGRGLRIFEVDHPATQTEKRAILAKHPELLHETQFVPVDFATDDLVAALDSAQFDRDAQSLVSWLGVTMYLSQETTLATLRALRTRMPPGSELIFDAYPQAEDWPAVERPLFAAARAFTASRGEPMNAWFAVAAFPALLEGTGWQVSEMLRGDEMRARWFTGQPKVILPPKGTVFCRLIAI